MIRASRPGSWISVSGRTRPYGVDADAFFRHFARQAVGERVDPAFGGGVKHIFAGAAGDGAIEDNSTIDPPLPPCAVDIRRTASRAQIKAPNRIDVDHLADGGGRGAIEPRILAANAGAIDEMRNWSQRTRGLAEDAYDFVFFRHVALQRDGFAARFLHRLGDLRRGLGIADVIDGDVVAALAGKQRGRGADAAATAGDEKDGSWHGALRC